MGGGRTAQPLSGPSSFLPYQGVSRTFIRSHVLGRIMEPEKGAKKDAEKPPRAENAYPPTESTATACQRGAIIESWRSVTTKYGFKVVMEATDGAHYWASPYCQRQLEEHKVSLPAKVYSYTSKKGGAGYALQSLGVPKGP